MVKPSPGGGGRRDALVLYMEKVSILSRFQYGRHLGAITAKTDNDPFSNLMKYIKQSMIVLNNKKMASISF